ncbi:histidine phosphatase family protein [Aeromicrobium fastidiosum]|uniref:Histidine phosphatase family protein n=1 Tax=Aeromicrobium fastidiosum TaxID=52699 RepID=A0A641APK7_9ACTN|nr:phosphoglycerate mutase family protein [Aeromicrobium fastidiosum]KAA1380020.1 histidine phosphatase family protein [Aeromicrobium fastidiosum]MBP2389543.1 broad specificity phosphatase PhoE [Aeromicrobium fastidiosum]
MILWVRHGQSTWNVLDRMQGHELSPPLTELGREQAQHAAESLAGRGVVRLLSSPATRALETAEIIGAHLGLEVEVEPLLLEKGLDENYTNVLVRVQQFLDRHSVDRDLPDHTVAVSHGDTIGLAVGLLSGQRPEPPANGSITSVDPATREVDVTVPPR